MDPDSSPPLPPHVQKERDDMDARIDMGRMIDEARKSVNERSPTGSPVDRYGRRRTMTTSPVKPSSIAGGKRRTKKKCGGKRHRKSKTSKKRGHKKSKTHKKRSHKKRA